MVKKNNNGFTLVELLVTLVIFSIILAGVYAAYIASSKHSLREHKIAESEMELEIAKNFIKRDITMANYGLAADYDFNEDGSPDIAPLPIAIGGTDGGAGSDTLTIMGTAVGRLNRAAQGWTDCITTTPTPSFQVWGDAREDVYTDDRVIFMEPNTKTLLDDGSGAWEFQFESTIPVALQDGTTVYGLKNATGNFSYYVVQYSMGGASPSFCASGTSNLLRGESRDNNPPAPANNHPLLSCVLSFQVAFGLDNNEDGTIDAWVDGGDALSLPPYTDPVVLRKRVKQVRVYLLVQLGSFNTDKDVYLSGKSFRVGDTALGIGEDITLSDEQRRYRWRVVSLNVFPRNLR